MNRRPQSAPDPVLRRYRMLLNHCAHCPACNADTSRACPKADHLRHVWSLARRGATA